MISQLCSRFSRFSRLLVSTIILLGLLVLLIPVSVDADNPVDPIAPVVTTHNASAVTTTTAQLNGSLDSLGTASSVTVSFQWSTVTGSYTEETPGQAMTGSFYFFELDSLTSRTTYYFRAKAVGDGTSYGNEKSFTTGRMELFVTIPGINDNGTAMISRARDMVGSNAMFLSINRKDNQSPAAIRIAVHDAVSMAVSQGKNIIVNVDMNLERYLLGYILPWPINRWGPQTDWAGKTANIVSEEFAKQATRGERILFAHSAGVDAAYDSVRFGSGRMYDSLLLMNGRMNAGILARALSRSGYEWWRVKVFTSQGDIPALPLRWIGLASIANRDTAWAYATSGSWVHLHCLDVLADTHSGLVSYTGMVNFEVNAGGQYVIGGPMSVLEAMQADWASGLGPY